MLHAVHGSVFYETGVIHDRSFTLRKLRFSTFVAPVTLILTQWSSYTNLTRIPLRYTGCANMNVLRQGFRKLSFDKQTDRTEVTRVVKYQGNFDAWNYCSYNFPCQRSTWVRPTFDRIWSIFQHVQHQLQVHDGTGYPTHSIASRTFRTSLSALWLTSFYCRSFWIYVIRSRQRKRYILLLNFFVLFLLFMELLKLEYSFRHLTEVT